MPSLSRSAKESILKLVNDLVRGNYASIEVDGRIGRLTREELERAITEYGRTLIPLPSNALEMADAFPVLDAPEHIAVDIPLWTEEEGRSDLTLSLTIIESHGVTSVSIDDLHVL